MGGLRAGRFGLAAVTAFAVVATAAPAHADDTVVVQGTRFPDPARVGLSLVGCDDLYQRTDEPLTPRIGAGPGAVPEGRRSLGFDLAGGNAVGALFTVGSVLATTTASVAVNAPGRAEGVAYAGYQEPADAGTTLLWLGRSELATPGGAWQTVEATTRSYTWAKYDMTTRAPVASGPSVAMTVPAFAAAHGGDGPGVYTIGFGCDGAPFSMDQLRVGGPGSVTTYDIEGLRTAVTIEADRPVVEPGQPVTISGRLSTETGDRVPHASMVLEQRRVGTPTWTPVLVAPVGPDGARAQVEPEERTFYRWRFVDRPLAEGAASMPLLLDVLPPLPTPTATPTPTQIPTASSSPAPSPSVSGSSSPIESTPASPSGPAPEPPSSSATASDGPDDGPTPGGPTQAETQPLVPTPSGTG